MEEYLKKAYILNLKFKGTYWRVWFMANSTTEMDNKWEKALKELNNICDSCLLSQEFYDKAIQHFQSYGFTLVRN